MRTINRIFLHTAAHGTATQNYDTTVQQIDAWHRERGWSGIGYHFVIRLDGTVSAGRSEDKAGAHVAGFNTGTMGICMSGHGDHHPWTAAQNAALMDLLVSLLKKYGLWPSLIAEAQKSDDALRVKLANVVLGHREVNRITNNPHYKTTKSCPGNRINMDSIRATLGQRVKAEANPAPQPPAAEVYDEATAQALFTHIRGLYTLASGMKWSDAMLDALGSIRKDARVDFLITEYKKKHGIP